MRRLKFRRIGDSLANEPRRRRQAVIRWIYITAVVGLAAVLGDIFVGSLFYLRSEGLVVGDLAVIAAEFPVTIRVSGCTKAIASTPATSLRSFLRNP